MFQLDQAGHYLLALLELIVQSRMNLNLAPKAKLSLAAQFDDLCRGTSDCIACFTGSTDQLTCLMRNICSLQHSLITLNQRNRQLEESNKKLREEVSLYQKKNSSLKNALEKETALIRRLRSGLETSQSTIHKICQLTCGNRHEEESNIEKIRETLKSGILPRMYNGADTTDDSLSDVDYDDTPDPYSPVANRSNNLSPESPSIQDAVNKPSSESQAINNHRSETVKLRFSARLPVVQDIEEEPSKASPSSDYFSGDVAPTSSSDSSKPLRYDTKSTIKSYSSNASVVSNAVSLVDELESKKHDFVCKPLLGSDTCAGCLKRITFFSNHKRCTVCDAPAHSNCADSVPLPCLRRVKSAKKKNCLSIADLVPVERPCVPPLIILCVIELERRDLSHQSVYSAKVPAMVPKLVREFIEGKRNTQFTSIPSVSLAGAIKLFLSSLDEPLISFTFWRDFAAALNLKTRQERSTCLWSLLMKLPGPNLDTVAYLMRHMHFILTNKFGRLDELVEVFASSFIGYPSKQPTKSEMHQIQQNKIQIRLMSSFISDIDKIFWDKCLETMVPVNGSSQVKVDKWPIRSSTLILNNGTRRVSIVPEGTCENGQIEPASNDPFL